MKRFLLPIALVAVAAMSYSCAKTESTPAQEGQMLTFRIVREGATPDDATKALIDETDGVRQVVFESGDRAGVIQVPSSGSASGSYGKITPDESDATSATTNIYVNSSLASGTTLYFYYPYGGNQTAYNAVPLSIPANQSVESAGYNADAMPMVAPSITLEEALSSSTDTTIKYYNLGSLLKFKVYNTNSEYAAEQVSSVKFEASDAIVGDFTYDLTGVDGESFSDIKFTDGTTSNAVEVKFNELVTVATSKDEANVLYAVIAPGSYSGTFTVTTDQAVYTYELSDAKTFKRSKCKNISFDLANGTRTAEELEEYVTVKPDYTNTLTTQNEYANGEFTVEDVTNNTGGNIWSFDSSYKCAKATAYISSSKTNTAGESYFLSPIVDLSDVENVELTFDQAANYFNSSITNHCSVLIRVKDGSVWGDWTALDVDNWPTSFTFVTSTVDLSSYAGQKIQIGFKYTSTTSYAPTWEIKNFSVKVGVPTILSVDPANVTFAKDEEAGTSKTVTVTTKYTTSVSVELTDEDEAFTVSEVSGSGNTYTFTITNNAAAGESAHEATITVTASDEDGNTDTEDVAVKQSSTNEAEAKTVTIDFTTQGYSNAAEVTSVTSDGITYKFDKGTGSNAPKYYTTGTAVRLYGGGTLTISGGTITKIVFTYSSASNSPSNNYSVDSGTLSGTGTTTQTWEGSAESVTLKNTASSGHWRFQKITVTYTPAE